MKLQITIDDKRYEAEIEVLDEPFVPHLGAPATIPAAVSAKPRAAGSGTSPAQPAIGAAGAEVAGAGVAGAGVAGDGLDEAKLCRSVVMGLVVRVLIEVGQQVEAGQPLLLLEAMKMESNVTAPISGTVAKILVVGGESVKKGQPLVQLA